MRITFVTTASPRRLSHAARTDMTSLGSSLDQLFLLLMGVIILFMQCGFAFLEAGSVRSKNTSNILIKNLLDSLVAGISFWLFGYPFAFGKGNSFIGWTNFASHELDDGDLAFWFFQFVLAATAATIVSGAMAERCEFVAYFICSCIITGFIYPVVAHWAWQSEGFLRAGQEYEINSTMVTIGYQDFAGSGVVHCVGGAAAFIGACIIGPRTGRFQSEAGKVAAVPIRGHSVPFAALGGFILVFGFMAFNGGSALSISKPGDGAVVSLAIVNTIISASMAAFFTLVLQRLPCSSHTWSLLSTINGALAGMVAICAGCNVIRPWGACVVGVIAGAVYNFMSWAMVKMKVDDPLDAVAVHFGGGSWGVISVAMLKFTSDSKGMLPLLFSWQWNRDAGLMFAWQMAGLMAITVWTVALCAIMFGTLMFFKKLRVSLEMEQKGMDITKHGESAYPLESYGHGYMEKIVRILQDGELQQCEMGCVNGGFTSAWEPCETAEMHAQQILELARAEKPEMTERKDITQFEVDATLQGLEEVIQKAHMMDNATDEFENAEIESLEKGIVLECTSL